MVYHIAILHDMFCNISHRIFIHPVDSDVVRAIPVHGSFRGSPTCWSQKASEKQLGGGASKNPHKGLLMRGTDITVSCNLVYIRELKGYTWYNPSTYIVQLLNFHAVKPMPRQIKWVASRAHDSSEQLRLQIHEPERA